MSEAYDLTFEPPMLPRQQLVEVEPLPSPDQAPAIIEDVEIEPFEETAFSVDGFKAYLQKIGRIPLLNAEQEVDLSQWIEAGAYAQKKLEESSSDMPKAERTELQQVVEYGVTARDKMIESNLRLVVHEAKRYMGRGLDLVDLVQEGNRGLIHAIEKFDYKQGNKFSTYALWWIRQACTRAIANEADTIRKPVHVMDDIYKIRRLDREVKNDTVHEASVDQIMTMLNIKREKAMLLREASRRLLSLDHPIGEEGDMTFGDLIEDTSSLGPQEHALQSCLLQSLDNCLSLLDPRELRILQMRYGLGGQAPKTLSEIGEVIGVTRERIRQLETRAIKRIKTAVEQGKIPNPFAETA